jgi:tetratricopeptide (TPR) repeat protein
MSNRIETIRKLLVATPADMFLNYSLAMELASADRQEEAIAQFARCLEIDPEYLPAYAEAGKTLRAAGKLAEAKQMFSKGVQLATKLGEAHTRDYLQQQLESLG